ncbi:MAG: L28 family ribosomal protein [Phycisphaerales bacterium]
MPRVCHFTGAKTSSGNTIKIRGKAKYLGGVGLKTTSIKKRTFKPNLQSVDTMIDGTPTRVRASVRAIRQGLVVKPMKRKYTYTREQREARASGR